MKIKWMLGLAMFCGMVTFTATNQAFASENEVWNQEKYSDYQKNYINMQSAKEHIVIDGISSLTNKNTSNVKNENNSEYLLTDETGFAEWDFEVGESGLYNIIVNYQTVPSKGDTAERILYIDGDIPFAEASNLKFSRIYVDEGEIKQDKLGNDIRPKQIEKFTGKSIYLRDSLGYVSEPLEFYIEKGRHTLRLESVKEAMGIKSIELVPVQRIPTYDEIKILYGEKGYTKAESKVKIEAELPYEKSDPTIYPLYDRGSPNMSPCSTSVIKFNEIGREKWQDPGAWLSWKINVPEDGLYKIAVRYKQDTLNGIFVSRELRIDGEVPFEEAKNIRFNSRDGWTVQALGNDDEDFQFYLTKGEHELAMEVTLGDLSKIMLQIEESILLLNEVYRNILMITGPTPDVFRDYNFEQMIPDSIKVIGEQAEILKRLSKEMNDIVGGKGKQMVVVDRIVFDLDAMYKNPELISNKLKSFKDNTGALATWIYEAKKQALELDWISIDNPDAKLPKSEAGFLGLIWHNIKLFFSTFGTDYYEVNSDVVGESDKNIVVWVGTGSLGGRDQAQILRQMVDDSFSPQTGINVDVKLVTGGTLLSATLAGTGPDIALQVGGSDPVNYAIRNAVVDLSKFPGFDEITSEFNPNALIPYTLQGGVYALPETYSFNMLFVRTDILDGLGLQIPKTWDDFYTIIPELQKRNMNVGIPAGSNAFGIYSMFLLQQGYEIYDLKDFKTHFDEKNYIFTFKKMTEFFTNYKLPVDYDFANRFRTGEMPIAITDYTQYNQLSIFAPEIRGRWIMTDVPGTVREDGTIDNTSIASGSACIMMKSSKNKDASWEFMKWWTGREASLRFARELESLMGQSARYNTANKYALEHIPWSHTEYENIARQWDKTKTIPEIPGGYITPRYIDFAFKAIVGDKKEDPGEQLLKYNKEIVDEIERKVTEFNLKNN